MIPLVLRHLAGHKGRSLLTIGAVMIAIFLLCVLRSLVTALERGVEAASSSRTGARRTSGSSSRAST
jgi:hypothetical protein